MKKNVLLFISIAGLVLKTSAQTNESVAEYKVPNSFTFNYKVVYEVNNEEKNSTKTMTYFFNTTGDFMGILPPKEGKDKMEFIVNTKDGKMLMFTEEHVSQNQKKPQKTLTIMDMRGMMKGLGEAAKTLPKNGKKPDHEKKGNLDNFKKTGRTRQIAGYTAQEYEKTVSGEDKDGKNRSGTMSIWYAKVDFDPSMMFSMGMGNLSGSGMSARMQQSHQNNLFGMGLTEKNFLLMEIDAAETGGKSGTGMKVISIEKTSFVQETAGYTIRNFGGMGMKDMMNK